MKIRFVLLAVVYISLVVCRTAAAAEQQLLYYIVDGSGSMWGRSDGQMKIEAAKQVMTSLIQSTPENIHGALMVYGNRRKADCADIEEIIAPGAMDKPRAVAAVKKISPKGMTPISDAISQAVSRIKGGDYAATIVLVSDGIETCDKDPCQVTAALKQQGINFVMHVVGFGIRGSESKQLECAAQAGGGRYFSTANAAELLSALNQIKEAVIEKREMAAPAATPVPVVVSTPDASPTPFEQKLSQGSQSIRIKASGPGRILLEADSWLDAPYYWKLLSPETGEEKAKFRTLEEQVVPPGEYQLVWRQTEHGAGDVVLGEVVAVESGKTTRVSLKTALKPVVPQWVKKPYFWGLEDASTKELLARFGELEAQLVPAGTYNIVWRQAEHAAETVVLGAAAVLPDQLTEVKLSSAVHLVPADWVPPELYYWALKDAATGAKAARFSLGFEPQLTAPGAYQVIYRKSEHGSTDSYLGDLVVKEGEMTEFALNTGIKLIPPPDLAPPYRIDFIELDAQGKALRTVVQSGNFDAMLLKPGTYKVAYRQKEHDGSTVTLVESVELPVGNLLEIEL